ncbi:MAG: hypothetical protein Q4D38_13590, partial [Planctomycetia bacterium]|nr:hypothetical protein [Planctomycetia bacterium]
NDDANDDAGESPKVDENVSKNVDGAEETSLPAEETPARRPSATPSRNPFGGKTPLDSPEYLEEEEEEDADVFGEMEASRGETLDFGALRAGERVLSSAVWSFRGDKTASNKELQHEKAVFVIKVSTATRSKKKILEDYRIQCRVTQYSSNGDDVGQWEIRDIPPGKRSIARQITVGTDEIHVEVEIHPRSESGTKTIFLAKPYKIQPIHEGKVYEVSLRLPAKDMDVLEEFSSTKK